MKRRRIWRSELWRSTLPGNGWWISPSRSWTWASASWSRNRWKSCRACSVSWTRCPRRCGCAWRSPILGWASSCSWSAALAPPSGRSRSRTRPSTPHSWPLLTPTRPSRCSPTTSPSKIVSGSRWAPSCSKDPISLPGNQSTTTNYQPAIANYSVVHVTRSLAITGVSSWH